MMKWVSLADVTFVYSLILAIFGHVAVVIKYSFVGRKYVDELPRMLCIKG